MNRRTILAWSAHAYTGLGLVLAAGAAIHIVRGDASDLRLAFLFLWAAVIVDATDGLLARRAEVARVLPGFDGGKLDDIIDYHTYVSLPLLLLWRGGIPGGGLAWLLLLPLGAAAYGFAQRDAKTTDGFFLGFPSLWNVAAFYLHFLEPELWFTAVVLLGFSLLTFVPTPYLYPSRGGGPWSRFTTVLGAVWAVLVLAITLGVLPGERVWVIVSTAFPAYYLVASWSLGLRRGVGAGSRPST